MNNINPQEEKMIGQLQQEAGTTRPDFSEALHTQICEAIASDRMRPAPIARRKKKNIRPVYRVLVALAGTAAAVAIMWVVINSIGPDQTPLPGIGGSSIVETPVPPEPAIPDPVTPEVNGEALVALQQLMASTTEAPDSFGSEMTTMLAEKENPLSIEKIKFDGKCLLQQIPGFGP